ncbi:substrate-binding domain-containing protein [Hominiventricola filiformis]|uniref:Substrate-binding domain-containing protein n=1 Tax=Hominiventricola filiformis TaxID=2885352 RepID=A0AAE3D9B8_9FIRM|nr:substrate-binding domain-containing protein [Hominiventricola filiformis]MCC2124612.1 substrate-binding domain-containing protein [Hominiventricola filiformis]MCI6880364.1 substrate-binding domain-containing protein [Clostridiaceae bacterium]
MKRKSLLALGMVVAMTATMMAGCGSSSSDSSTAASDSTEAADTADTSADAAAEESKGGDYKIAVVPKMTNIGWFQRMEEGVNDYNKENGTDYVYRGSAEGADQAGIVEQMLAEDWDAICVVPFDSESLAPVLEKAREQGIVVITHEASSMDPKYFDYDIEAFVNADYGTHFAEAISDITGGEGTYIQFVGDLNSVSHNEWCDAADEYFAANTNMKKLGRYETGDDTTSSYNQTKELLQANPDITAIEGSASTDVVGAAQAVDELGLTGKVAVVGTSMTSIARNYVEKDVINTFSVWDPAKAGQAMIELAIDVLDNGEAPDALNVEGYESLTADGTVLYGNARVDVTKDNMDEYDF